MKSNNGMIGKSIPRIGAIERLLGKPLFSADMELDHPLVLKVLPSDRHHARILDIDTAEAARVEGVVEIFTAEDIPRNHLTGIINKDRPLLAKNKVRSKGDAVALVAALNIHAAETAAKKIHVVYEDLPSVHDPEEALKNHASKVHEKGNLLFTRKIKKGNPEKAFEACAVVVEKTYRTSFLEHTYLEPDAGAGYLDPDGNLVIIASTQNPHYDHSELVSLLGVAPEKVRIVQAATGGGFGSKLDLNVQGFIGLALYHLKRPVMCTFTREETYRMTAKRHPLKMVFKTGADENGHLMAMTAKMICDTGAYGSYGLAVASRAPVHATGPYEIDHVDVECRCVYTNNPFAGAMRGFGVPQAAFAHESQMDLLAEALGMDPLEIRRVNALKAGHKTATGQLLNGSVGIDQCLEAVKPHYENALKTWLHGETDFAKQRGVGLGAMWYGIGNTGVQNPSTAHIEMDGEGRITLYTGCADIGQGSTTVLSQIAAAVLGISPDMLCMVVGDTAFTSNAGATSASRQTYISGNAVKNAAEKLADVLLTEGVDLLKRPKTDLMLENGFVVYKKDPDHRMPFSKIAARAAKRGIPLRWQGYFDPETVPLDPETGEGVPYATYAFACHVALVTVDVLTGEVTVHKIIAAHDVGRAIHPASVEGQIRGGAAMGVGFALMEEYDPSTTRSLKDYHIPTAMDMPEIIPIIIESSEPTGPFGAKGVGEPALIPTAPAVINGITNAVSARIYHLPANLERVLEASIQSGKFTMKEVA
ncbi:aldehyde oxidase and xanthine dehydrogenase, molybdopterin binding domain protein [delta proteobacterium NaphS2]|nr:aldehyde oxidase and xanthine dehydrogenase, molybdopterin binding domain protein [delta proteobacterium NaphS2]